MGIESVESTGPRNVEIGLRSLDQEKTIALEDSDEDKLLHVSLKTATKVSHE